MTTIRSRKFFLRYLIAVFTACVCLYGYYHGTYLTTVVDRGIGTNWSAAYLSPSQERLHLPLPQQRPLDAQYRALEPGLKLPASNSVDFEPSSAASSTPRISALGENPTFSAADVAPALVSTTLPCTQLKGADDVVLIIKTGATEALEKLPVHFETTRACVPHFLVFSDYEEEIDGFPVRDALDIVSDDVRLHHDDFAHWRKLHESGRAGLDPSQLSKHLAADDLNAAFENGGWKIDRFKNLPMVLKTLEYKADAKWYVYTDADTYITWSNLLNWTSQMNHTRGVYLGSPSVIDGQIFGHGGSGYILSQAAMHAAAHEYRSNQTTWDEFAARHWAGDCVLSHVLEAAGVTLTFSYPIIQGQDPTDLDFVHDETLNKKLWCYPAVSYHHVSPETIASLWRLEQLWIANMPDATMRHSDVFLHWLLPQVSAGDRIGWDNLSMDKRVGTNGTVESMDVAECRQICEADRTCLQFSVREGECKVSDVVKLGHSCDEGTYSSWLEERILAIKLKPCEEGEWALP